MLSTQLQRRGVTYNWAHWVGFSIFIFTFLIGIALVVAALCVSQNFLYSSHLFIC